MLYASFLSLDSFRKFIITFTQIYCQMHYFCMNIRIDVVVWSSFTKNVCKIEA